MITLGCPKPDTRLDDFERASLGADWAVYGPADSVSLQSGSLSYGVNASTGPTVVWQGSVFGPNQFSQVTLSPLWVEDATTQVFVRSVGEPTGNGGARYGFVWAEIPEDPGLFQWVFKYDGVSGPETRILAKSGPGGTAPQPGDVLRVEVDGIGAEVNLRGYLNGVLTLNPVDTDANRITTGDPVLAPPAGIGGRGVVRPGVISRWVPPGPQIPNQPVASEWFGGTLYPGV